MIKCQQCGHENQLGRIYCVNCRAKLQLKPHADAEMPKRSGERRGRLKHVIIGATLFLIACVTWLLLLPENSMRGSTNLDDYKSACRKINLLHPVASGESQTFTQAELNAYMAIALDRAKERKGSEEAIRIESIFVSLRENSMRVQVDGGPSRIGLGKLAFTKERSTFLLVGTPETGSSGFRLILKWGKHGHLPLPSLCMRSGYDELVDLFSSLTKERIFLDRIASITISEGKITLSMRR